MSHCLGVEVKGNLQTTLTFFYPIDTLYIKDQIVNAYVQYSR